MKEFKIDILLMCKNIIFYIVIFIIVNVLFPRKEVSFSGTVFLFIFLFLLVVYDIVNRFRMMLIRIFISNNENYEITLINRFVYKKIVLKKTETSFLFEDKLYGRGSKITFFSIWHQSNKICEIKIPSDGWSKKKLDELVGQHGRG